LKQEEKSLRAEVDKIPKAERKDTLQRRLEELKIKQQDKERDFHANLQEEFEQQTLKIHQEHKQAVKRMEEEFLSAKQDLIRGGENELWELEQQHLHERHQLAKHQLKEAFLMHRHQMHCRHEKELEQHQRQNQQNEEELLRKQNLEKKQMPKVWKNESRNRLAEFRKGLRNQPPTNRPRDREEERDRLKQFEAQELRKQKGEQLKMEMRHETEMQEIKTAANAALDELKSLQV
jgi:DNA-directed RNA polymerase subunit H (RpoH/RPB5)